MSAADPDLAEAPDRLPMVRVRLALGWCVTHLGEDELVDVLGEAAGDLVFDEWTACAERLEDWVAAGGHPGPRKGVR